jgi:uncharacterized membrane protein
MDTASDTGTTTGAGTADSGGTAGGADAAGAISGGEPATTAPARRSPAAPPWVQLTTLALSLGGLGVSLYLTVAHYTTPVTLSCPDTGIFNCEKVTTSPESVLFGIFPVAVIGLAFYVFMVAVNSPWAWRAHWPALRWARLGALAAGVAFVLYLIYTELFTLDAICPWCTSVHVITLLLFVLVVSTGTVRPGTAEAAPGR